ncbi:RtcB family protein [Balneolaceae bacterium ANBcel3]|nr:RtcB family protein [Balneolaceae bacterium ANBcel3]
MLQYIHGNPVFGLHDEQTLSQFTHVLKNAERGALMADGHLGYVMPIGGVAAYNNHVSPVGVGFDIGCGNLAVRLDMKTSDLKLSKLLNDIERYISFGIGQTNTEAPKDHPVFDSNDWKAYEKTSLIQDLKKLGREQLGTVGAGNHYIDIFSDESMNIWIGVHFGSRGLGHKTASGFINLSQQKPWDARVSEIEVLLDLNSDLGERYYRAMRLCGAYAKAGREWVCSYVARLADAPIVEEVHNHHNYAWKEVHDDKKFIVIRKGATPAFPGQVSFVGGSMGDPSVILEGIDSQESRKALYSTVHGAGRVMSRTKAAGKFRGRGKNRKQIRQGAVTPIMMNEWLKKKKVELRGGGLDESPHVYRRLTEVLNYHQNTIKIKHWLQPLGVVMAGPDVFDPFRD